jgi:quinol monooxygenase YgiN
MHFFLAAALLAVSQSQVQDVGDNILSVAEKGLSDPTKPFMLLIQFTAKEGQAKKFEAAMARTVKETRKEKGNLTYELSKSPSAPRYFIYERWKDLAALKAHLKMAYYQNALEEVLPLLETKITVEIIVPVPIGD